MNSTPPPIDRRTFLRRCGRLALLVAGAAGTARLHQRGQVRLSGQTCTRRGLCPGCSAYPDCGLPQALSRRRKLGTPS